MTKKILYSVFAMALLTSTIGCPPPAPPADVDVDTTVEPMAEPGDNMTATAETPSDNVTAVAEVPAEAEAPAEKPAETPAE